MTKRYIQSKQYKNSKNLIVKLDRNIAWIFNLLSVTSKLDLRIILQLLSILSFEFRQKVIKVYSRGWFSRKCSASKAAIQPDPAAVTA